MNEFLKDIITEEKKNKKQQRYFYAKAGDESLPKEERNKWKKWSKEFSDKTDFEKLPEVAETEGEVDEIVDSIGNISRSKIPTDANTKGITQKKTTDQVVKTGAGSMGIHGVHGTHTSLRYWAESDMSKTLGYDATMKQDASKKEAEKYFKKELDMDDDEAEERLDAMGYDPELPEDKVRLVENPKKFIEEYIENILSKKSSNNELVSKEKDLTEINPIVLKQVKSLKQSLESNEISIQDLIKLLKDNE